MKDTFLKSLDLDTLKRNAYQILEELTERKRGLLSMKHDLKFASEKADLVKADLRRSEDYLAGKNAEAREAWLLRQKVDCPDYADALRAVELYQDKVEKETIEIERIEKEFVLARTEIELAASTLRFMGA